MVFARLLSSEVILLPPLEIKNGTSFIGDDGDAGS